MRGKKKENKDLVSFTIPIFSNFWHLNLQQGWYLGFGIMKINSNK
jgi:hypothetical protein